ncbi:MAG: ROK family protein [Devosia sp.]
MSRTRLAVVTGLSNASITAIGSELIAQGVLAEGNIADSAGARGRPAVELSFNRRARHAAIIEIDVTRVRCSLVDYAGTLVDRIESPMAPEVLADTPPAMFLFERIDQLLRRNPAEAPSLQHIAVSVQGILDRSGDSLKWSPIAHMSGQSIVEPIRQRYGVASTLVKRGGLLADGARLLYPDLGDQPLAAVFVGSTVAMGLSFPDRLAGPDFGATEFGHMNHIPGGALCRCGQKGCIEAYAADYGVLRTAYAVPEHSPPAPKVPPAAYDELVHLAQTGRRTSMHAFNLAGRAIGFGLSRLMTIAAPAHIVITGPGASAFALMRSEIETALRDSLVCRINGQPTITVHHDEREPIFQGLLASVLGVLDTSVSALHNADAALSGVP